MLLTKLIGKFFALTCMRMLDREGDLSFSISY